MKYGQIYFNDIANGIGCRTSLFVSGCTHHCEGCFNAVTWDFDYGDDFTDEIEKKIIESLKPSYINGLTILGGEPMEVINQRTLRPFIERVKRECPNKTIWIYSGYTLEELTDSSNKRCHSSDTLPILEKIDILVDGEFQICKKDLSLKFRGSSNQRIINVKKTFETGDIVLSDLND